MAKPLSLTTYLALARREKSTPLDLKQDRPSGYLIWLHCNDVQRATALADLGQRLAAQIDAQLLLTVPHGSTCPVGLEEIATCAFAPSENAEDIAKFLNHWRPDSAIWMGRKLRAGLIQATHDTGIPLFLIDADDPTLTARPSRWLPSPKRAILQMFDHIFARDDAAAQRISRLVRYTAPVTVTGPLIEENPVLPCNADDLEALSETLVARPCWLAARVQPDELPLVLDAQRSISRLSPRILLILVPDLAKDAADFRRLSRDLGFHIALWDDGVFPSEKTDILLAENPKELGLFYRIAPITFVGSSLKPGHGGRDPFDAAALGSAVLYGPSVHNHLNAYTRLANAHAARVVQNAPSLVRALEELMAPDKVATMVHAGWDTVSQGAGVINQIVSDISAAIDKAEAQT
ncbi:MAG: 3-deoxy-D-manno-octulosonic acid transferase [Cognatishimia sp.]|nr:3-deoxy-D-manno-octulosonic acid transferase [Cognatishimia sp.]